MWPDSLNIKVSRETAEKLQVYHELLLKWQKAINIVSPATISEAWIRHFADSAQIVQYIPEGAKVYADLGCGGGFPGLVVAMMRPDLDVHLVESDERKCQFMRTVSRETSIPVTIHTDRIESVDIGAVPDVVSARALADLRSLLGYVIPWAEVNPELVALFLKGAKAEEEIAAAQADFVFSRESFPSVTDTGASILRLRKIARKA